MGGKRHDAGYHARCRHVPATSVKTPAELDRFTLPVRVDLPVCHDVIQYLDDEVGRTLARGIRRLCDGVAHLSAFTAEDDFIGDRADHVARLARWYRWLLAREGWRATGGQCWPSPGLAERAAALELP